MWPRLAFGAVGILLARSGTAFFQRALVLLRQLWHEVIGFLFLVLAVTGASNALREYNQDGLGLRFFIAIVFVVMMAYFGVTSFRKARKVKRPATTQKV
jgi:succinate dehydrogenase hydrophobic anchor subunit